MGRGGEGRGEEVLHANFFSAPAIHQSRVLVTSTIFHDIRILLAKGTVLGEGVGVGGSSWFLKKKKKSYVKLTVSCNVHVMFALLLPLSLHFPPPQIVY